MGAPHPRAGQAPVGFASMHLRCSRISLACLLACASLSSLAQTRPDAGQTQREVQPSAPLLPDPGTVPPSTPITVQPPPAPANEAGGTLITPSAFIFSGHDSFSAQELAALVQSGIGTAQSLRQLSALIDKITQFYRSQGYPFAQAFLPPQDIIDGKITVTIVEGKYGQTLITNNSKLRASVIESVLAPLASGKSIQDATLQRQMLLLQDIPGIEPNARLETGTEVGTADLRLTVNLGASLLGSAEIDNFGGEFTGRNRLTASLGINNPAGLGDQISLRGMSSGAGLNFLRLGYQMPIGGQGFVLSLNASTLRYKLGGSFAALEADGKADSFGITGNYPLIRSVNQNLRLGLSYERKSTQDSLFGGFDVTERSNASWTALLSGDRRDGSGVTAYAIAFTAGKIGIDPAHLRGDQNTARTAGHFDKINISAQRFQSLSPRTELAISFAAQWANKNLASMEKMTVGGTGGVRAYTSGEASGDQGQLLNIELRYALTPSWLLSGFIDAAQTQLNQTLWRGALGAGASNVRSISGAGLGLQWSGWRQTRLRAQWASRLGHSTASADKDSRSRFWLQASVNW